MCVCLFVVVFVLLVSVFAVLCLFGGECVCVCVLFVVVFVLLLLLLMTLVCVCVLCVVVLCCYDFVVH